MADKDWDGVSLEEWIATGQYPDGTPLDENDHRIEEYYGHYKETVKDAIKDGDISLKKAVERQHGIIDTGMATEGEKEGYVEYVLSNDDLRETSEALGLTRDEIADFGQRQYEYYEVGKYIWNPTTKTAHIKRGDDGGLLEYSVTRADETATGRLNRLSNAGFYIEGDPEMASRTLDMSDNEFENLIRGIESDPAGYGTSQMWQARGLIGDEFGDPWNLAGFSGAGWNMDPDNPYARGIRAGTIDVATDVGQLINEGSPRFLQDRYEDEYRAQDFPENWVGPEGNWQGPPDLGDYWKAISGAIRDPNTGEIESPFDRTWGYNQGAGPGAGSGTFGATNLGAYTPMEAQDWSGIMPQGVFAGSAVQPTQAMQGLVANQGLQYQPWAMSDNSVAGSPFVSQNVQYTPPPNYNPVVSPTTTGATETTNGGTTYGPGGMYDNYQDWFMAENNPFGHYWALQNADPNSPWTNTGSQINPNWSYNAATAITPTVTTADGGILEYGDPLYDTNVTESW